MLLFALGAAASADPPADRELIYWKQNLLTVPYQWTSTSGGAAAKSVSLYVSKDRGASWQPISDAQPQLLAFNYRAEADGEYWFAIRTTDDRGSSSQTPFAPGLNGSLQPELRVIVDTMMPRIESLSGQLRDDGTLEARWRVTDVNLGAHSCNVEVQTEGSTNWQPVPLTTASEVSLGTWEGSAVFTGANGSPPVAVRAMAIDLAGNRAVFQSAVKPAAPGDQLVGAGPMQIRTLPPVSAGEAGWYSSSSPSTAGSPSMQPAEPQLWAADGLARAPLGQTVANNAAIVYGTPLESGASSSLAKSEVADDRLNIPEPKTEDRPLGNVPAQRALELVPSQPFRQVSMSHVRVLEDTASEEAVSENAAPRAMEAEVPPLPANPLARHVNSRTFALEYELAEVGAGGVAKVELWGTRDGGKSWQKCAEDEDNRSPLQVSVDQEGEYGFSIVVVGAGGDSGSPPQAGDTPALWVSVDLQPPLAQILSVDTKRGQDEGELTVRWDADDDNLERRPISLYYSSRPAGPWTTIATNLENSGEFAWPVERHVPRRVYLKLEARDTAGNIATFQTSDPLVVEHEPVVANWLRLPPVE